MGRKLVWPHCGEGPAAGLGIRGRGEKSYPVPGSKWTSAYAAPCCVARVDGQVETIHAIRYAKAPGKVAQKMVGEESAIVQERS